MYTNNHTEIVDLPLILSVGEAAAVLRIGRAAAYNLVRVGTLRSIRVGRKILIPRAAIDEFIGSAA